MCVETSDACDYLGRKRTPRDIAADDHALDPFVFDDFEDGIECIDVAVYVIDRCHGHVVFTVANVVVDYRGTERSSRPARRSRSVRMPAMRSVAAPVAGKSARRPIPSKVTTATPAATLARL